MKTLYPTDFSPQTQPSASGVCPIATVRRRSLWLGWVASAMAIGVMLLTGIGGLAAAEKPKGANEAEKAVEESRPILAIWRDSAGRAPGAPYLRIAIWADGRIVFARDPKRWGHDLLEGKIKPARLAELKKAVEETGVFALKGTTYLVPDAPVDCVLLDLGEKQQMLRWDEREAPGYGINIDPKPHHVKFMSCWKEVNALALAAIPKEAKAHEGRFEKTPKSWLLKPAIQSE